MNLGRFVKGQIPWNKGKKLPSLSEGQKKRLSELEKGKRKSKEMRENMSIAQKKSFANGRQSWNKDIDNRIIKICQGCGREFKIYPTRERYGKDKYCSIKCKKTRFNKLCELCGSEMSSIPSEINKGWGKYCSIKCKATALWKRDEYVKKQMISRKVKPNKTEMILEGILNKNFPLEYKFVGDGQFILNGKCPDFLNVNGQKKLIELYGEYWHKDENPQDRINYFREYGFETLVIWERELRDKNYLKKTISDFNNRENLICN